MNTNDLHAGHREAGYVLIRIVQKPLTGDLSGQRRAWVAVVPRVDDELTLWTPDGKWLTFLVNRVEILARPDELVTQAEEREFARDISNMGSMQYAASVYVEAIDEEDDE